MLKQTKPKTKRNHNKSCNNDTKCKQQQNRNGNKTNTKQTETKKETTWNKPQQNKWKL